MKEDDAGASCGSVASRRAVVRIRRAWLRGLFEKITCQWHIIFEFHSKPDYDNRSLEKAQLATRAFASFAPVVKEGERSFSSVHNLYIKRVLI